MNEEQILSKYIPPPSVNMVVELIKQNKVHLKITNQRKSKLGDYRPPVKGDPSHRISINYNLNKYSFLLTFLHELAHLRVWVKFKNTVSPHGKEWKQTYNECLIPFLTEDFFPQEILEALFNSSKNFKASTGSDLKLMRVLSKYDNNTHDSLVIENLEEGEVFFTENNRVFIKGRKRRTRFLCVEQSTKRQYIFHPFTPVKKKQ